MKKDIIYLNLDEQIKKLEDAKKMIFDNNGSKEVFRDYLKWYGYNVVTKSLSHPLMYTQLNDRKIYLPEFTSDNLRYLIDVDKNISIIFWKYFRVIEMFLNSMIVAVLYKFIDKKTNSPFIAKLKELEMGELFCLTKKNSNNIANANNQKTYNDFFKSMTKFYKSSNWLMERAKHNEKRLDSITKKIIDHSFIFNELKESYEKSKWQYLEIFNLSSAWTFSFCVECFNTFTTTHKNKIINDFFKNYKQTNSKTKLSIEDFSIFLEILSELRNKLAHNEVILNFQCGYNKKNLNKIFSFFDIQSLDNTTINLNEMLLIFEKIIGKNSIKTEIEKSISNKLIKRTKRGNISPILFTIIEDLSKIKLDENIKDIIQYNCIDSNK